MLLNLGCGPCAAPGWLNCDVLHGARIEVRADVARGLPFAAETFDGVAAIHVLQDLPWPEIDPTLRELYRVLKQRGVLRIAVPDLERAIRAYLARDAGYFYVRDVDAHSIGAKLVTQIVWYGSVRTPCTFDFLEEWLQRAGFARILRRPFGHSLLADLAHLDNRERESLFVEASKG